MSKRVGIDKVNVDRATIKLQEIFRLEKYIEDLKNPESTVIKELIEDKNKELVEATKEYLHLKKLTE